jgi:hypothetical protein
MTEDPQQLPHRGGTVSGEIGQKMRLSPAEPKRGKAGGEMHLDLPAGLVQRGENLERHDASRVS